VAERERQRPHHPQALRDAEQGGDALGDVGGRRALAGEDLDQALRRRARERPPVQAGAAPALCDPLLAGAEVVDVAEGDVAKRRAVGDREGEREERDPALRVHGSVDRVDDDPRPPAGPEGTLAELLRDENEVRAERLETRDDRVLRGCVDRRRVVASFAGAEHRLPLGAGRQVPQDVVDVRDAAAAEAEPVRRHTGWKRRPLVSLGKK